LKNPKKKVFSYKSRIACYEAPYFASDRKTRVAFLVLKINTHLNELENYLLLS